MRTFSVGICSALVLICSAAFAGGPVVTPLFPLADGDTYPGSDKVDRTLTVRDCGKPSVAWITYYRSDADLKTPRATLTLYLQRIHSSGELAVCRISQSIERTRGKHDSPYIYNTENPVAVLPLTRDCGDSLLSIDVSSAVRSDDFLGLALIGRKGLMAVFSSREAQFPPLILLSYDLPNGSLAWYSGTGNPDENVGKIGDLYVDLNTSDVLQKIETGWVWAFNLIGPIGACGPQGERGDQGPQGATGLQGPQGEKGDQGLQGVAGTEGPQGPKGDKGDKGDQGIQGIAGPTGPPGDIGPVGATGPQGPQGEKGDQGTQGLVGRTGPQGIAGPVGATGPQGPQGVPGSAGLQGLTGATGAQGPQGLAGQTGPQGFPGHSPVSSSQSVLSIASSGTVTLVLEGNRSAFDKGQRVRISAKNTPSNFMEGTVTDYLSSTGTATVLLDYSEGSGASLSQWNILSAGVPGRGQVSESARTKIDRLALLLDREDVAASFPPAAFESACAWPCSTFKVTLLLGGRSLGTVIGFMGNEGISTPYRLTVAVETAVALNPTTCLDQEGVVEFLRGKTSSYFAGIITSMGQAPRSGTGFCYVLTIEPKLSLLTRSQGSKTYLQNTTSDIITNVLNSEGLTASMSSTSRMRPFTMRYQETPFNFMSRLAEEEGLHYHFRHAAGGESVVFGLSNTVFLPISGELVFNGSAGGPASGAAWTAFSFNSRISWSTKCVTAIGHDFLKKKFDSWTSCGSYGSGSNAFFKEGLNPEALHIAADLEARRLQMGRYHINGTSDAWHLRTGHTFSLKDATGVGLSGSYVAMNVAHICIWDSGLNRYVYCNSFDALPSAVEYAPPARAPLPRIQGNLTGIVTNINDPDGMDRVKVKLNGQDNLEGTWARVFQPSTSPHVHGLRPDVDDEVLVSFIEGNPEMQVVLGKLYSNTNQDAPPDDEKCILSISNPNGVDEPGAVVTIRSDGGVRLISPDSVVVRSGIVTVAAQSTVALSAGQGLNLDAGTNLAVTAGGNATIKNSGTSTIESSGSMQLKGSTIRLNQGNSPAARVGDNVINGKIATGSSTVLIGQ